MPIKPSALAVTAAFGLLALAGCRQTSSPATGAASLPAVSRQGVSAPTLSQPSNVPVPAAPPHTVEGIAFENAAERAGLNFRWPPQPRPLRNLEAFGSGCAFLDFDNDGWQDILLVGSSQVALYRNKGDGTFQDVSWQAGLAGLKGYWTGCAIGDVDGDGYLDILLTGYGRLALLRNVGGVRFEDITAQAGLDPRNHNHWGSSAGFMDLRGTGKLDLVLCNYVVFNSHEPQYCEIRPGLKSGCPPSSYKPEYAELWENTGGGKFREATAQAGMKQTSGKALVVAFADYDGDGKVDFYIGNDGMPAELMHNEGGLRFKNAGVATGVAYGAVSHSQAAMGADWADYDRDGRPDLAVSAFSDETYSLYHNLSGGAFELTSDQTNLSGATLKPLGFGTKWLDMDNDGWPDLLFANGHVYDNVNQIDPTSTFRQPLMLFHNEGGRQFRDLVPLLGDEMARPLMGRGLATGDYDNDGRIDFLVVDFEGTPFLAHNVSQTPNHWITLDVRQPSGGNRFAYGAQITARADGQVWTGLVSPASSYLSSSDPRLHFGLGPVTTLDTLAVRWPDGRVETWRDIAADRIWTVTRGQKPVTFLPRKP